MESLTETLLFILPWLLLGTALIFYGHKDKQYKEACINLNEALINNKEYRDYNVKLEGKITGAEFMGKTYEALYEKAKQEAKKWEKLATCPPITPVPDPVFRVERGDFKLLCSRTLLPYNEKGRRNPEDIKRAVSGFLEDISGFIYTELTDKGYAAEYYQEIYVANPKKLHYEK